MFYGFLLKLLFYFHDFCRQDIQSKHKLDFQVIQLLISCLPKGQQVLDEVSGVSKAVCLHGVLKSKSKPFMFSMQTHRLGFSE